MRVRKIFTNMFYSCRYALFKHMGPSTYPTLLKLIFLLQTHTPLNLSCPKTYNEKMQWLKLYDNLPVKAQLADKYEVRNWVAARIGAKYLVPLLGVWNNFDEIDFAVLPQKFVLKCTHGCGCNIIVKNKNSFDTSSARRLFAKWAHTNYAYHSGELQYKDIQPRIIAEEYIENSENELHDYKVFCFNGKAKYIMYLQGRHSRFRMAFYDASWKKQPFVYTYPILEEEVEAPKQLNELLSLAEALSAGFCHVRVDFYILNDGSILFGEMTFSSASGLCKWNPPMCNRILGDLITLPCKEVTSH